MSHALNLLHGIHPTPSPQLFISQASTLPKLPLTGISTKTRSRTGFLTRSIQAISVDHSVKLLENSENALLSFKSSKERISKMLNNVELSVSSYDTAWVAMVPSHTSLGSPYFPECLNWLLENQLPDGSWGLPDSNPFLVKDTLLSTLASILALKRWNIGEEHVNKGLHYITSNFASTANEKHHNPIGFDIIFPGMIEYAQEMGINFHLSPTTLNYILQKRDSEINRGSTSNSEGSKLYLAYVAEGLGKSQDWKSIMKYQRKNGSLFNSPSNTAAVSAHLQDINCLNYLHSVLDVFGNSVPTACPLEIYTQLCLIDDLESLGISRHFKKEIDSVLDRTYSCWLMKDEEIFLETATCAMAFRILRGHGYDVSSDALGQFSEEDFSKTLGGYVKDTGVVLELYRASHFAFPDEIFLEEQKMCQGQYLKRELSKSSIHADRPYECIRKEVDVALSYPNYANLQRLENRRRLEHYDVDNLRILKSSYRPANVDKKVILELAIEDFNLCQSIQQKELKQLERWVEENRLDKLTFARQKQEYCYFSAAATLFPPELFDARMSWAKNSVLTTVVDDFYDGGGSREELLNLIELVEKWAGVSATDICSEQVEILFNAIRNTINEVGEMAMKYQHRNVTRHITEIWLTLIKSMMKEAEWLGNKTIPMIHEYNNNAYKSIALGPIVLPALYFVGPYLSDEVVRTPEYHNMFRLMSTCGRNLNDIQGFERENNEGKLNGISLLMLHDPNVTTEEEAARKMRTVVDSSRKELMRLVLQTNGSVVPRACKELFWNGCRVVHLFYAINDGLTSAEQMVSDVNAVIFEPLKHE
uniref:Diterpene synthase class I n=1 Tax=Aconitum carmichaelii TaxID=85363 RepID=A0A8E8TYG2_ACOCM|nr:diterpene synthase class I [Aconitum carmichaelii]